MKALDIEAVQAFVLTADLKSFTRAAEAMDTTQSAVSLKIKRLEDGLGRKLLERTPRLVRLSADGNAFLGPARNLVAAHHGAVGSFGLERRRLVVGISHHLVGAELPLLLKRMSGAEPSLVLEMRVSTSREVIEEFDRGLVDAAIVLRHDNRRRDGEIILNESFGWMAMPDFEHHPGRTAAARNAGRSLQRAQHGDRRAKGGRHCLDGGLRRRRCRHDRRRGLRGPCGRGAWPPRRTARNDRCRRAAWIAALAHARRHAACECQRPPEQEFAQDACRNDPGQREFLVRYERFRAQP